MGPSPSPSPSLFRSPHVPGASCSDRRSTDRCSQAYHRRRCRGPRCSRSRAASAGTDSRFRRSPPTVSKSQPAAVYMLCVCMAAVCAAPRPLRCRRRRSRRTTRERAADECVPTAIAGAPPVEYERRADPRAAHEQAAVTRARDRGLGIRVFDRTERCVPTSRRLVGASHRPLTWTLRTVVPR